MRPDDIEKLRHDRSHPAKMAGSRPATQGFTELFDLDMGLIILWVDLISRRIKERVNALLFEKPPIALEIPRIGGIIFVGRKLRWIDENRNDHPIAALLSFAHKTQMAFMKKTHRRDKNQALPAPSLFFAPALHRLNALDNLHSRTRTLE
jgi:hypothetical protein